MRQQKISTPTGLPERYLRIGPTGGAASAVRKARSRDFLQSLRSGHSTDPEEAYGIRGGNSYRDYDPSPTSDLLMDSLYRPPSVTRSGSVTPVIDEEARIRMINMEKQLANLSTLVHSALMTKGVNETVYKDLEMLRREILGSGGTSSLQSSSMNGGNGTRDDISDSGSVSRFSDISSDKGSSQMTAERDGIFTSAATFSPIHTSNGFTNTHPPTNGSNDNGAATNLNSETKQALKTCKRRVGEIQSELKNLRRLAQLNAQSSRDILKDAFDRIKVILNTNKHLHMFAAQAQQQNQATANGLTSDRNVIDQELDRFRKSTQKVERDLGDLEKHVEDLRQKVINGERKLKIAEVENFTDALGQIGRSAAQLKGNFPTLQDRLKHVMSAEMEKVVREEKFLKDEPGRVDSALKRCKKLTNTMVTMKKLAMVQDPSAYYGNGNTNKAQTPVKIAINGDATPNLNGAINAVPPPPISTLTPEFKKSPPQSTADDQAAKAKASSTGPMSPNGHVLDTLLEELQSVAKTTSTNPEADPNRAAPPASASHADKNESYNGHLNGNSEKRVGFSDEVQILSPNLDPNESDTIKRMPKVNGNLGPIMESNSASSVMFKHNLVNGYGTYGSHGHQPVSQPINTAGSRRRSASPLLAGSAPSSVGPFRNGGPLRSHSGTPSSVTSDPPMHLHHPPPPPPPRSSSRSSMLTGNPNYSEPNYKNFDLDAFKQQLKPSMPVNGGGPTAKASATITVTATPAAIVQTNAMDDEESRMMKSASSSESISSQEGRHQKLKQRQGGFSNDNFVKSQVTVVPPGKPPPPPPPPRNKQEMLEQRQHELLTKQLSQNQSRYMTKF